jgi:hypothetical protein
MLISFNSKACADFFMLSEHACAILELMGKPFTPQGVITVEQLGHAIAALEAGLLSHEATLKAIAPDDTNSVDKQNLDDIDSDDDRREPSKHTPVSLKQRAWPLLDMMRRAQAKQTDVIWGA